MSQKLSKKIFHISMIIIIFIIIGFIALLMALRYDAHGEVNMPFDISKISIISTIDGKDVENSSSKWDLSVSQNNDIYIYVEKNKNYAKTETIDEILIDNFKVINTPKRGEISFYRPSPDNTISIFENNDEYKISDLKIKGEKETNIQNYKISNQGGIVTFRCGNNHLGEYISNEEDKIEYTSLLKKININIDDIKASFSFDITIRLNSKVSFKATNIEVAIPFEDVVQTGKTSTDITNLKSIAFKRVDM